MSKGKIWTSGSFWVIILIVGVFLLNPILFIAIAFVVLLLMILLGDGTGRFHI